MGKNERIHSTVYSKKLNIINIELSNFREKILKICIKKVLNIIQNLKILKKHIINLIQQKMDTQKIIRTIKSRFFDV